jgi:hypothetical protein
MPFMVRLCVEAGSSSGTPDNVTPRIEKLKVFCCLLPVKPYARRVVQRLDRTSLHVMVPVLEDGFGLP